MRKSPSFASGIQCADCGKVSIRTSAMQKYCRACSEKRSIESKAKWHHTNFKERYGDARSAIADRGSEINETGRSKLINFYRPIELVWQVLLSFPFSWGASKNHIYSMRDLGHAGLRDESRNFRSMLTMRVKEATKRETIVQNKIWIDIFVQKPNHKGDAANFVDLICDSIKDGIGIDDRWFCIRRLDWEIVKKDPLIFISIGQECVVASQACSSCGRILPLADFQKNRAATHGHSRNCKDCSASRPSRNRVKVAEEMVAS